MFSLSKALFGLHLAPISGISVSADCDAFVPPDLCATNVPQLRKYEIQERCPIETKGALHEQSCEICKSLKLSGKLFVVCEGCEGEPSMTKVQEEVASVIIANMQTAKAVKKQVGFWQGLLGGGDKDPDAKADVCTASENQNAWHQEIADHIRSVETQVSTKVEQHKATGRRMGAKCDIEWEKGNVDLERAGIVEYSCLACQEMRIPEILTNCCAQCLDWGTRQPTGAVTWCSGCENEAGGNFLTKEGAKDEARARVTQAVQRAFPPPEAVVVPSPPPATKSWRDRFNLDINFSMR